MTFAIITIFVAIIAVVVLLFKRPADAITIIIITGIIYAFKGGEEDVGINILSTLLMMRWVIVGWFVLSYFAEKQQKREQAKKEANRLAEEERRLAALAAKEEKRAARRAKWGRLFSR